MLGWVALRDDVHLQEGPALRKTDELNMTIITQSDGRWALRGIGVVRWPWHKYVSIWGWVGVHGRHFPERSEQGVNHVKKSREQVFTGICASDIRWDRSLHVQNGDPSW